MSLTTKKRTKPLLTAERLREVLNYDPETGLFRWLKKLADRTRLNAVAGSKTEHGHCVIRIDGRVYSCHRLAWLYVHGRWPSDQIDHINWVRDDTRIANLRECSNAENNQNRRGIGVSFNKRRSKWKAEICVNYHRIFLGEFRDKESAIKAYYAAKIKLHPFWNQSEAASGVPS